MDAWATVHWFLRAVSLMKNDMGLSSISSKSGPRHLLRVSSPVTFFPSASLKPPSQRFCTKLIKKFKFKIIKDWKTFTALPFGFWWSL